MPPPPNSSWKKHLEDLETKGSQMHLKVLTTSFKHTSASLECLVFVGPATEIGTETTVFPPGGRPEAGFRQG